MFRTVFSARLVGLHLATIVVLVAFALLGRWQLGVFEDSGRPRAAADPPPVPVATLVRPGQAILAADVGRQVTARGAFDAGRQLLVAGRPPDSTAPTGDRAAGFWVLTPLTLADGTAVPVVRGWVARADDPAAAAVPSGTVTVTGRLRPSETTGGAPRDAAAPIPGQVTAVSSAELINLWPGTRLVDGYVIATAPATGGTATGPAPRLVATPPPTVPGGFTWRNLAYAAQWWIFAVFAAVMWYHFVRDAVRGRRGPRPAAATTGPAGYREATEPRPR